MGTFVVNIEVAHPIMRIFVQGTALVDTGAIYSVLPATFLRTLDIVPTEEEIFTLSDGKPHRYGVGEARFRFNNKERTTPVVFGPSDHQSILGAVTLESFALIPDTTKYRLIPANLLMVGMRWGVINGQPTLGEPIRRAWSDG